MKLKTLIPTLLLAAGLQRTACGQQYGAAATLIPNNIILTNGTLTSIVSNYNSYASLAKYQEFNLALQFKLVAAGNGPVAFTWTTSDDGTNWATSGAGTGTITLNANGTTFVNFNTNFYIGSAGYFSITNIAGATNNATTNLSAVVWIKPKRNG
ncbi:MAG TPA: hypothetical protein VHB20_02610 [Verrucomicrobiae bacterium]|jgi:hypothetical protein|nr:hypothetical protein [Verrucomicrobiae bacterium]